MAEVKQNGIVVNPSSGSGDTTLQVKAEVANRGNRVAQSATFEVEGTGVAEKKQFVANHLPAAEFIQFDNTSPAVDKEGGTVTLTGKSNTSKITFSKGTGDIIAADIAAQYSSKLMVQVPLQVLQLVVTQVQKLSMYSFLH